MQGILRAGVLCTSLGKERLPCGFVAGQRSGALEGIGLADQPHASAALSQAGVVDLTGGLQTGEQHSFLGRADPQRDLTDKGGRASGWVRSLTRLRSHRSPVLWVRNIGSTIK